MTYLKCAACGLPGHRYGRNEGMERFDPMACINQLRGLLANGERVGWCEPHKRPDEFVSGRCSKMYELLPEHREGLSPCSIVSRLLVDPPKEEEM